MQARCPLVVTFHGSDLIGNTSRYNLTQEATVAIGRLVNLLATRSIVVADVLGSRLWFRKAVTIPMGVDLSLFKPMPRQKARAELNLDKNRQLVLFVANPKNYIKRFDIAQAAVSLLQVTGHNVELLPVYNIPHHKIPLFMNAGDALVLTSIYEGSPCVIKEAMACNIPIVSVDVGDVFERISGVEGCYLCDRTPEDIAGKLRLALANESRPDTRSRISDLSLENVARRVIAVYEQALNGRNRLLKDS
jgi:glycosyltransferase involved in cell wall biosynthesis